MSAPQRPRPRPLGPAGEFQALETLVHFIQSTTFFAGQQNPKPDVAACTSERGFPAAIHRHPYCLSHTRQGGCPQWSWGSDPGVGLHGFASSACPLTSASQRGRRKEAGAAGQGAPFSAQNISCLSSGRLTMHVRTRLPARERRPRVTPTLASSVCESETKTSHTPGVYPPALRTLRSLKHTFIMIFNLSGGFLFSAPLWSWI